MSNVEKEGSDLPGCETTDSFLLNLPNSPTGSRDLISQVEHFDIPLHMSSRKEVSKESVS